MKTMLMLGAIALATSATISPASARKYAFTFASPSGATYCDGVAFTYAEGVAIGYHVYDGTSCAYQSTEIAGTESRIKLAGPGKWFFFALPPGPDQGGGTSPFTFFALLNAEALKWDLAYESTAYGIPFEILNSGALVVGPPSQHGGGKRLGPVVRAGLAHIRR
jgi:hypothetical protein